MTALQQLEAEQLNPGDLQELCYLVGICADMDIALELELALLNLEGGEVEDK